MTTRRTLLRFVALGLALSAAGLTAGCGPSDGQSGSAGIGGSKRYPDYWYRLSVEVITPEGVKRGSSVIEVSTTRGGRYTLPGPGSLFNQVRGEAVAVDLGPRGVLFALLRSDDNVDWASYLLPTLAPPVTAQEREAMYSREPDQVIASQKLFDLQMERLLAMRGPYIVPRHSPHRPTHGAYNKPKDPKPTDPPSFYPMLVRFTDIVDPKSVARVNPDDLSASFGKGVKLSRITVERTNDAVTTGIEERLAKIGLKENHSLDNDFTKTTNPTLAQSLGYNDFFRRN